MSIVINFTICLIRTVVWWSIRVVWRWHGFFKTSSRTKVSNLGTTILDTELGLRGFVQNHSNSYGLMVPFHHIWTDLCDIFHYHYDFGNELIMFFSQNIFLNSLKKYNEILPKIQSYQLKAKRLLMYSKRLLWIGYRQYEDSFHSCMMVRFYK